MVPDPSTASRYSGYAKELRDMAERAGDPEKRKVLIAAAEACEHMAGWTPPPPARKRTKKGVNVTFTAGDLRAWREQSGLPLAEFAERLGVSEATILRWETGSEELPDWLYLARDRFRSESS